MKRLAIVATVVLALSACSAGAEPEDMADPAGGGGAGGGGASSTEIDCSLLSEADRATYGIGIQFLAQIRDQGSVDLIRAGTINYDPDEVERFLNTMRMFEGVENEPFGNPADGIAFFLEATEIVRSMLAADGPVSPELFDDLAEYNADLAGFLQNQISINAALSDNCA